MTQDHSKSKTLLVVDKDSDFKHKQTALSGGNTDATEQGSARKQSFTPGPWRIAERSANSLQIGTLRGTQWRDIVTDSLEFAPSYVAEALERDAYLIAAAPLLLDAAERIEAAGRPHARECECEQCEAFEATVAAIAAATERGKK